jgi:hypothetical protein
MNTLKMGAAGYGVPSPEGASDSLVERVAKHSRTALVKARDSREPTARSMETFPEVAGASEATVSPGSHQSQGKNSIYQSGRRDFRTG